MQLVPRVIHGNREEWSSQLLISDGSPFQLMLRFQIIIHGNALGSTRCLPVTFEHATATMQGLDRMLIEPDGSFVWAGALASGETWQVDGNLMDRGDRLACVELKGCCPEEHFSRLLNALGWPQWELAFQLQHSGVFLDEAAFRRRATSVEGAV